MSSGQLDDDKFALRKEKKNGWIVVVDAQQGRKGGKRVRGGLLRRCLAGFGVKPS